MPPWKILLFCIHIYFIHLCFLQPLSQLLQAWQQSPIKEGKTTVLWPFYNVLSMWAFELMKTRIAVSNVFHLHVARWKKQTLCEDEQARETLNALNTKGVNAMQWFCFCYRKCKNSMLPKHKYSMSTSPSKLQRFQFHGNTEGPTVLKVDALMHSEWRAGTELGKNKMHLNFPP